MAKSTVKKTVSAAKTPSNKVSSVEDPSVATPLVETTSPKKMDLSDPTIQDAIGQGQALIKEGKSKADAARLVYDLLQDEGKDVIVATFIAGANLTEKGALTYWYNCKRKSTKTVKQA